MKLSPAALATLAMIPLAACLPQPSPSAGVNQNGDVLADLFKVDGDHWLEAVKEEATRQEAAGLTKGLQTRDNKFKVHAMYTDNMINLGDVDIFANLWQRMYDVSNDKGGLSDTSSQAWSKFCNAPSGGPGVDDRFILDGQWGAVNGVSGWQMRDALIHSMWKTADTIANTGSNRYPVYRDCYGFTWQEARPNSKNSACGGQSGRRCPENGDCPYGLECKTEHTGHWLPSIVRINVYNPNGSLRADAYQARISSQALGSGGCDKLDNIASALVGFLPGPGPYFAAGISVQCTLRG